MPLSEFLRLAMEKLEASKKKSCSTDHSISRENNSVEVVWEDSPTHHSLSPTTPNVVDATLGNSTTECVGGVDSMLDDISPVVASEEFDLTQNYDYFSEISGVKANETSGSKRSSDEANKYLDNDQDTFKFSSHKPCSLSSWPPQQGRTSRLSGVSTINRQDIMFGNGFSKHASVVQPNLPVSGGISSPGVNRMKVKETNPACRCSDVVKSMLLTQNTTLDGDRNVEPIFASSFVGSGISGDRVSYEETLKRKLCDIESECLSDDIQTESVRVEKLTVVRGDTGAKKSRTTQVHNLSERRRRDRINEKMRALQQLIPNCNKADKTSVLDDAIQYLKNLQHQVQSMSMGGGLCVPPMMFAPGSHHVYPAPIPHYSPMGVGMGIGMGMSYPIFPVHANYQGIPVDGPLRIPTTSSNLNSEDPIKRNSHNAEPATQSIVPIINDAATNATK